MFNVRLAGGHLYGKQLFTWLSLVVSLMASFVLPFFPLDVLDEIWDLIESVSEGFLTYSYHYVASWYRHPGGLGEEFQLFRDQLDHIRTKHKGKKLPSVHVLGDFNFKDIAWPDRLNKSGSVLSQSEGHILIDVMNDHGLEQLVQFPTWKKNTFDLILTSYSSKTNAIKHRNNLI